MKNKEIVIPDYKGGSIVNLMSSIGNAVGYKKGHKSKYVELRALGSKELKKYKNIVLMIIDGLGYEYIKEKGRDSFLDKNMKGSMTSVFLSTTACAVTAFLTGIAPQQHAYTGWFVNLKELGLVSRILLFSPRVGDEPFSKQGVEVKDILNVEGFASKIKSKSYAVSPRKIINSDFNNHILKNSKEVVYDNLNGFFNQTKKAIKSSNSRKYINSYWLEFDESSHKNGVNSKDSKNLFKKFDKGLKKFVDSIKGTNTLLIISADHGFIDTPLKKNIMLEDHPQLKECLTTCLCGDARTVYCYVKPSKVKQFEKYIKTKFKKYCWMYKSEELVKKNMFGLFDLNPKLLDRIGDYTLICKENYVIMDRLLGEKKKNHLGHHAGISKKEMLVPLVVIDTSN
ncbi:MAG: alkaline phosphatase family protein [archaeon]